jgi:hypothetical protein
MTSRVGGLGRAYGDEDNKLGFGPFGAKAEVSPRLLTWLVEYRGGPPRKGWSCAWTSNKRRSLSG